MPETMDSVSTGKRPTVRVYKDEFWTSAQRQASRIHEISYRACFKPQVPRFFIERFTRGGDSVLDPFAGRGTTAIEAILMNRRAIGNDVNPLSAILTEPRVNIPLIGEVRERLREIDFDRRRRAERDLSMFFHPRTEGELVCLKEYLARRRKTGEEDGIDKWIRMTATNRLTGHSSGFFSVYTLPPNQAASPENQKRINRERRQKPSYRSVPDLILRKTERIIGKLNDDEKALLRKGGGLLTLLTGDARDMQSIGEEEVQLTVTSPPFLDVVDYAKDNWLRCWFNNIDANTVSETITRSKTIEEWSRVMFEVFLELFRVSKRKGVVAFEVGEIRNRTVNLDEVIVPLALRSGFDVEAVYINEQRFTKTSNIWGIRNNVYGTNTNRIVLLRKP